MGKGTTKKQQPWDDPRLDPRQIDILKLMAAQQPPPPTPRPDSEMPAWDELAKKANSPKAQEMLAMMNALMINEGDIDAVPKEGLTISKGEYVSSPDGNTVPYITMRPSKYSADQPIPCIFYIHGGGMATLSVFYSMYQTWLRLLAHQGVAVFAVDFRNSMTASASKEVKPYPAGLNDCLSGLKYLHSRAGSFGVDANKIVVAGESGGGNLTIATVLTLKAENKLDLISGFYPLCPYVAGHYPQPERFPSTVENNGILLDLGGHNKHTYGIDAYNAKDPCAWPSFATVEDLKGLPPVFVSVNECDPLRDEGIEFYRTCVRAGLKAQCRIVVGTMHAAEIAGDGAVPDVSRETARSMASFAWGESATVEFVLKKSAL